MLTTKILYIFFGSVLLLFGLSLEVSETAILLLFGYVGILTHYVKKWSEKVEKDEVFNLKKTIPSILLSLLTTSVLIVLRSEIINLFVFTKFGSFIVGYFGNSWFFSFIEKKMSGIAPAPESEDTAPAVVAITPDITE